MENSTSNANLDDKNDAQEVPNPIGTNEYQGLPPSTFDLSPLPNDSPMSPERKDNQIFSPQCSAQGTGSNETSPIRAFMGIATRRKKPGKKSFIVAHSAQQHKKLHKQQDSSHSLHHSLRSTASTYSTRSVYQPTQQDNPYSQTKIQNDGANNESRNRNNKNNYNYNRKQKQKQQDKEKSKTARSQESEDTNIISTAANASPLSDVTSALSETPTFKSKSKSKSNSYVNIFETHFSESHNTQKSNLDLNLQNTSNNSNNNNNNNNNNSNTHFNVNDQLCGLKIKSPYGETNTPNNNNNNNNSYRMKTPSRTGIYNYGGSNMSISNTATAPFVQSDDELGSSIGLDTPLPNMNNNQAWRNRFGSNSGIDILDNEFNGNYNDNNNVNDAVYNNNDAIAKSSFFNRQLSREKNLTLKRLFTLNKERKKKAVYGFSCLFILLFSMQCLQLIEMKLLKVSSNHNSDNRNSNDDDNDNDNDSNNYRFLLFIEYCSNIFCSIGIIISHYIWKWANYNHNFRKNTEDRKIVIKQNEANILKQYFTNKTTSNHYSNSNESVSNIATGGNTHSRNKRHHTNYSYQYSQSHIDYINRNFGNNANQMVRVSLISDNATTAITAGNPHTSSDKNDSSPFLSTPGRNEDNQESDETRQGMRMAMTRGSVRKPISRSMSTASCTTTGSTNSSSIMDWTQMNKSQRPNDDRYAFVQSSMNRPSIGVKSRSAVSFYFIYLLSSHFVYYPDVSFSFSFSFSFFAKTHTKKTKYLPYVNINSLIQDSLINHHDWHI